MLQNYLNLSQVQWNNASNLCRRSRLLLGAAATIREIVFFVDRRRRLLIFPWIRKCGVRVGPIVPPVAVTLFALYLVLPSSFVVGGYSRN